MKAFLVKRFKNPFLVVKSNDKAWPLSHAFFMACKSLLMWFKKKVIKIDVFDGFFYTLTC